MKKIGICLVIICVILLFLGILYLVFVEDYSFYRVREVSHARREIREYLNEKYNEDFKEFLFCAFDRGRIEAGEAVRQLESLGHTSGHDTLFGAFLALKRLERVERIKK